MKRRATILGTGVLILMGIVSSGGLQPVDASTQFNVNINIGPPPPVIVRTRPTMVFLPEPAAYVAVGIPYDIFFVSGRYYYLHGNDWFWAQGFNGPWVYASYNMLPPGLRKFRAERLHEFREREYRVYRVQGQSFQGKHFEAEEYREDSKPGRGISGNKGRGNSGHDR